MSGSRPGPGSDAGPAGVAGAAAATRPAGAAGERAVGGAGVDAAVRGAGVDAAVGGAAVDAAVAVIGTALERVFGAVAEMAAGAAAAHRGARERGARLCDADVTALREPVLALLRRESELAVGMGLILAPGLLADRSLRMEWWQAEPDPVLLEVDLNPGSVGYYDYAAAEWFTVPRRTGRRHVVGPYVDVHGTDRYLLTLTVPVLDGAEFVGVAGADVPVAWFESLVLRELGAVTTDGAEVDVVVVNDDGRVVLSTSPDRLVGSRAGALPGRERALSSPSWRVVVR